MDYPVVSVDKTHHVFDGSPIYEQRFLEVRAYNFPGLAAARDDTGAFHIDFFGSPVYNNKYAEVGDYHDSTAWAKDANGRYIYIDELGRPINTESYVRVTDFCNRVAAVYHEKFGATHITTSGEMLYHVWYYDVRPFEDGKALVRDDVGWLYINLQGEILERTNAPDDLAENPLGCVCAKPRRHNIAELFAKRLPSSECYDACVFLIRHAEREPLYRGEAGFQTNLTPRGKREAEKLQAALNFTAAYASPMPRCMNTAEIISNAPVAPDTMLGNPGAFIYDNAASHEFYQNISTVSAIRSYVMGAKLPGHYPIEEGANRLYEHLKSLGQSGGIVLCVTHDAFAAAFISVMTGYSFADDWIDFLDGCILFRKGEEWTLVWREGEVELGEAIQP